jgi:hypothetical protein
MISKSGRYWSTGITVHWSADWGWAASLDYLDDGFANDNPDSGDVSTEGTLHTRYCVRDGYNVSGLTATVDALVADAKRLGIEFQTELGGPHLFYKGDGESGDFPPPAGWREILSTEAARLGWEPIYLPNQREAR